MADWNAFAGMLIDPKGYQEGQAAKLALSTKQLEFEKAKQDWADRQGLRNALTTAGTQNADQGIPEGTPALPIPQTSLGPGNVASMSQPATNAQPLQKNLDKVTYDYLKKNNPEAAQHFENEVLKKAAEVEKIGGIEAGAQVLNDSLGWKVTPAPQMDHITFTDEDGAHIATINKRTGELLKTTQIGKPKTEGFNAPAGTSRFEKQPNGTFKKVFEAAALPAKLDDAQAYAADMTNAWKEANPGKPVPAGKTAEFLREYKKIHNVDEGAAEARNLTREDRSYTLQNKRLEALAKPLPERLRRVSTLIETLNNNKSITDATIAPEWLSVIAGGQGTGLRMTESELNRVENGRTRWESLQSFLNKWSPTAQTPSIPETQRQAMLQFAGIMRDKIQHMNDTLDKASSDLTETHNVDQQRQIVDKAIRDAKNAETGISGKVLLKNKLTGEIRAFKKGDPAIERLLQKDGIVKLGEE